MQQHFKRKIVEFYLDLDIFIVPLGPAMRYLTARCSPGWGNLVTFDWNNLPVGREFNGKVVKNVKSALHSLLPPHLHCQLVDIDRCITPASCLVS